MFDIIIIGGGAAGLAGAVYGLRAGKSVAIFEGNKLGGILNNIGAIENYPGFKSITGKKLAKKLADQALAYSPTVIRAFAVSVTGSDGDFSVYTGTDEYKAKKVLYCGGAKRRSIRGADKFLNVSYCAVCDGNFYKNKTVAVAGSGYAAEEDVLYLKGMCKKVVLIGKIEGLDVEQYDLPILSLNPSADNEEMLQSITLKGKKTVEVDGLFVALGASSDNIIEYPLADGKVAEGLYVAGDAGSQFKQVVWACATAAKYVSEMIKTL